MAAKKNKEKKLKQVLTAFLKVKPKAKQKTDKAKPKK